MICLGQTNYNTTYHTSSRLASQLLVCMDELARWRAAGLRGSGRQKNVQRRAVDSGLGGLPGCVGGSDGSAEATPPATTTAEKEGSAAREAVQSASANVMVLAATNAPGAVDAAFLRPGRFDEVRGGSILLFFFLNFPPTNR